MSLEVQDRVAHQLPRPVEGRVSPALDLEELHPPRPQKLRRGGGVSALLRFPAERDHRRMLYQEKDVIALLSLDPPARQGALQIEHRGVGGEWQVEDGERGRHG